MIDSRQWGRIKSLFDEAVDLSPAERRAHLDQHCPSDPRIRAEVETLLQSAETEDDFLIAPPSAEVEDHIGREIMALTSGDRVGPYEIKQLIASGGMGEVYLAARADDAFTRDVAVKVVRRSSRGTHSNERFDRERRLLAQLDHPNITRLLDGGTTDDGIPYLVMEFVDGTPIDQYCNEHALTVTQRLQLFQTVCKAVAFAHQNLIVHRDLKPSNILVRADGSVMLLDFGIARLLDDPNAEVPGNTTLTRHRVMTPEYASPEQIRGDAVTTATDVYSLGVILYELLAGVRPYQLERMPTYEAERTICEVDPPIPSATIARTRKTSEHDPTGSPTEQRARERDDTPGRWRRRLSGDLDVIVMTALRKHAAERYASVDRFNEDIDRHLNALPIHASRETALRRLVKFARRNRAVTGAAAVGILSVSVAIVSLTFGILHAQNAEDDAIRERNAAMTARAAAQDVMTVFEQALASANPYRRGRGVTVLEMLDDAEAMIANDASQAPEVEAGVRLIMARTYAGLMMWPRAAHHAERSEYLFRRCDEDVVDPLDQAECLSILGRARTHLNNPQAIMLQRRGLEIRRSMLGDTHPLVAESTGNLGFALWSSDAGRRDYEAGEAHYKKALDIYAMNGMESCRDAARITMSLGFMYFNSGQFEASEACYQHALKLYADLAMDDMYEFATLSCYAALLSEQDRIDEAIVQLELFRSKLPKDVMSLKKSEVTWRLAHLSRMNEDHTRAAREACAALAAECELLARRQPDASSLVLSFVEPLRTSDDALQQGRSAVDALRAMNAQLGNTHRVAMCCENMAVLLDGVCHPDVGTTIESMAQSIRARLHSNGRPDVTTIGG